MAAPICATSLAGVYRSSRAHQRVAQGGRDSEAAGRAAILVMIARIFELARFQYGLSQLFDEQRHTVGLVQNFLNQIFGQRFGSTEPRYHRGALRTCELGDAYS